MTDKKTVYIDFDSYSEGGEAESDEAYSNRSPEYISLTINGVHKTSVEAFGESVKTLFNPRKGMKVWLVTVRYTTGDTFGHSSGNYKFIACYDNGEDAESLAQEINANSKDRGGYQYSFKPKTPYVEDELYCGAWTGYFESLDNVQVDGFTIEK